ncbi:catalase [Cytobacillus sp. OWB-43]|uniref:catalase n=1 Tax=Cytobacillus sp. OWB-43 TaxID=3108468 RepID=UPI002B002E0E|nr:catalase [Cytobacillus sp. OWB-43]MEA1855131.1 catalase [Cytobacillus sp. OWB-43]
MSKNDKDKQLKNFRSNDNKDKDLTTNGGVKLSEDDHSLKAGTRGPTLLEDFHLREKLTHFDHERIPERVVHARGFGAHGEFQVYDDSMKAFTKAKFLTNPHTTTPVFVRFSTVVGSRGSLDTPRDARGFATKFYTEEGNYDLVGNNIPVFFIQDGIKFPDLIHAVKPEPHNEMPQAASAHDTFWDWVSQNQESAHMVMWVMSDRGIPRSYRTMEGFGVHTFRLVNDKGEGHFVKFHWKPVLGTHSLVWDEAQKLGGKDPDFNRRDLWESIEAGDYAEYELGVQILEEKDEFSFDFDILDPTKIWPEEEIPVRKIGKMTLNRNVDNVFAETEQVAFQVGNVVPGIDFTNDPLLQARLFSYTDTQLIRLGGPNFHELPINRPVCPFHNNQRDGYGRQTINTGQAAYHNNTLANGSPNTVEESEGGYAHYQEKVEGRKIRERSDSFEDHFSQATLYWNSLSDIEKEHTISAFQFELSKVESQAVKERVVEMFSHVNSDLANRIAEKVGVDAVENKNETTTAKSSPALSQQNTIFSAATRKLAIIVTDGFEGEKAKSIINDLQEAGVNPCIISDRLGTIRGSGGVELQAKHTFASDSSVVFDGVYLIGSDEVDATFKHDALLFIDEAYQHFKPIAATGDAIYWIKDLDYPSEEGILLEEQSGNDFAKQIIDALSAHRFWNRSQV